MTGDRILLYPYMTEKVVRMSGNNVIAFIVSDKATRTDVKNSVEKLYPPPTYIELNDLPREEWEGYTKKAIKALSFSMDSVCEICGNQICTNCHHCPVHGNMDAKTRGIIRVLLDLGMEKSTLDTVFKTANHP